MHKIKSKRTITVAVMILVSFIMILAACSYTINQVQIERYEQIEDARKRDFEVVYGIIEALEQKSYQSTEKIAENIETQIHSVFDLDELKEKLDADDPEYTEKLADLIATNTRNIHLNQVNNNRNSIIVLEGYDTIIEDFFIDPDSRDDNAKLKDPHSNSISKYRDTTYNKELFDSAMRKIRNHTDSSLIAIEPYNYIKREHMKISEPTYDKLEEVYVKEGINGLRNYQILTPVYITDSGDIFGQYDKVNGVVYETHKFIVIQTFNLYDQIMSIKPDFGDDDYIARINIRYNNILNSLYILGIITCVLIVIIIVYFISIYNAFVGKEQDLVDFLKDNDFIIEKKDQE